MVSGFLMNICRYFNNLL